MKVVFFYDLVCPYAYLASRRIERICERANVPLEWKPVLLGGLYKLDKAPQGKDGSATDVLSAEKKAIYVRDLMIQLDRNNTTINFHPSHPVKSLFAQRLLVSAPHQVRAALSHDLYRAYMVGKEDISDPDILNKYAKKYNLSLNAWESKEASDILTANTQAAHDIGGFGVPIFIVEKKDETLFFWGQDRLHFVEQALGLPRSVNRFAISRPLSLPKKQVKFYFDLSSPWSFLGWTQLKQLQEVADVVLKPVLVGAIFKAVKTANVPGLALTATKAAWGMRDLDLWSRWWGEDLAIPPFFPVRSVLPLRAIIVEPKCADIVYRACWQHKPPRNIADATELKELLLENGFDAARILSLCEDEQTKQTLRQNNDEALADGVIGVPSYKVDGFEVVWGQDRLDVVLDYCCGWQPFRSQHSIASKL